MAFQDLVWTPYEPKTGNRFIMYMEPAGIPSYIVKAATRPNVSFAPVQISHINIVRKFKGRAEWGDLTIQLYDPITADGSAQVQEWVRQHHEAQTGVDGYAFQYKKQLQFDALGPDGLVVETWILNGAFISSVDYGGFDWDDTNPINISLTLAYDYAVLESSGVTA